MEKQNTLKNHYVKQIGFAVLMCLTLGLAPFFPEPHLFGKLIWVIGGGEGMKLIDYWDLIMHGAPFLFLFYTIYKYLSVLKK